MSKFTVYSYGIVAEPKVLSSREILVTPLETMPFFDGDIRGDEANIKDEFVDKDNKPYAVEVMSDHTVKAEWLPLGNENRDTPPDVRRGERVLIYRYEQNDKFYWQSTGQDQGLRRLETVVYRFSDNIDEGVTKLTDQNSYWLEVSTHKQMVQLQTVMNNGEKAAYGIQVDGKEGKFTVKDHLGNHIFIDSLESLIELGNSSGTHIALDKNKMLLEASESVTVNTKEFIVNAKTATFKVTDFLMNASSFIAKLSSFNMGGSGVFSGPSLKHKAKKIDGTHTHTPPGGPVTP